MCIRYNHRQTERMRARPGKRFVVYKVYRVYMPDCPKTPDQCDVPNLTSPHRSSHKGGLIKKAGTYRAANDFLAYKCIGRVAWSDSRVTKKDIVRVDGDLLNVWGFHCFLSKKSAMTYNHELDYDNTVVVPLMVDRKDLIVAGEEGDGLRSATFSRITISKQAFAKALKGVA